MRFRVVLRILRAVVVSAVVVVLVAFAYVQIQQSVLRHRAERLLADFQAIRLKQSTWADAQVLMKRWGAWGHYDGACTASDCTYKISLIDTGAQIASHVFDRIHDPSRQMSFGDHFYRAYNVLGGRSSNVELVFLVQDGLIRRDQVDVYVSTPPQDAESTGSGLILVARASDHLIARDDAADAVIEGDNEQLTQHAEYKAGQMTCTVCTGATVTFTPYLPADELRGLTAYNFDCFSGWHACLLLSDVLSGANAWIRFPPGYDPKHSPKQSVSASCGIPAFVLGRDASDTVVVDALSTVTEAPKPNTDYPENRTKEIAKVRLVQVIEGSSSLPVNDEFAVKPFSGYYDEPLYTGENLQPGKRYVLFIPYPISRPQIANISFLSLGPCGALEDSPAVREGIKKGIARQDPLRRVGKEEHPLW